MAEFWNPGVYFLSGDLYFKHEYGSRSYQIQVTRECLEDAFGAENTEESMTKVFQENIEAISNVAVAKIRSGAQSPVKVMFDDVD